jgi:hypothetical protein
MEWHVTVNGTRADNIWADTFMEAELSARIQHGLTAMLNIKPVPEEVAEELEA